MRKTQEEKYIQKRKRKAFLESVAYYVCHIFPVKNNKIVMWTFEGDGGYACSPKYIAEELLKSNRTGKADYKIYWLMKDFSKEMPKEIIKVHDTLWARAFHLSTAKYWVGNTRTFLGTVKRKKTCYIQTWHGSLSLKPIGKYRGDKFSKIAYLVSEADSKLIDYAISGSTWCTNMWPDGLIYDGTILELGSPRCDVLLSGTNEMHRKIRETYNLPQDARICLYAPTFRGGSQSEKRSVDVEPVSLDFNRLIHTLEKRFGGEWYVFLRLHPQLAKSMEHMPITSNSERLIDVSKWSDMAELMAASDCIITDYSTVIFEGFLSGQPGFIYADDFDAYVEDRGTLMFTPEEIPFAVAQNNDELMQAILEFDQETYTQKAESFIKEVGIIRDAKSSKRVAELIR